MSKKKLKVKNQWYKPPKSWDDLARKKCIDSWEINCQDGYVDVKLGQNWYTNDLCPRIYCAWDKQLPNCVYHRPDRRHWASAFKCLLSVWDSLVYIEPQK